MKFKNINVVGHSYFSTDSLYTIRIEIEYITAEEARQIASLLDKNICIVKAE